LGNGSNVLFPDEGLERAVLHLGKKLSAMRLMNDTTIECGSGAPLKSLCEFAWENALTGLEFAYGIPGSVGGAIFMNAGAYDGEIKDVLIQAHHVSLKAEPGSFLGDALNMGYRRSVYSQGGFIITRGVFRLEKGDKAAIRAKMDDFMSRRRDKQPLEFPSAGSTFKRPEGAYASALIDRCGLKAKRVGGAMVSEKHAGFVINAGGATRADVLKLIELIQKEVKEKTGFELECEVRVVDSE
jgi:UDP-N-acetylmuramate dehydrogenase